jgi:hypothetical protein
MCLATAQVETVRNLNGEGQNKLVRGLWDERLKAIKIPTIPFFSRLV